MEQTQKQIKVRTHVFSSKQAKFYLTGLMDLSIGDLLSRFITQHGANMALIKLSLIKVSLILLARLIDLICLSSTMGCDLYLVNELIDLAQVYLEESKRILTCCPFNLAYSRYSLGHEGYVLAKV